MRNKKVIGKMKNKTKDTLIVVLAGLKSTRHSYIIKIMREVKRQKDFRQTVLTSGII